MAAPFPIRIPSVPGKKLDIEILGVAGQPKTLKLVSVVNGILRRTGVVVAKQLRSEIQDLDFTDEMFSDLVHCLPYAASVSGKYNIIWSTHKSSRFAQALFSCFAASYKVSLSDAQLAAALDRAAKAINVDLPSDILENILSSLLSALNIRGSKNNRSFPVEKSIDSYLFSDFERDLLKKLLSKPLTLEQAGAYRFKTTPLNKIKRFLECSAFIEPIQGLGYRLIGSSEYPEAPRSQGPIFRFAVKQSGAIKIGLKYRVVYLPKSVLNRFSGIYINKNFGKIRVHDTRILDLAAIADGVGIPPSSTFELELNTEEMSFNLIKSI